MTAPMAANGRPVLAIVPALDESGSIQAVVRALLGLDGVDVLVVDDGSVDATAVLAASAGASVLSLPVNLGIGAALQAGFQVARARGYGAAIQFDGDGQHQVAWVDTILEPVRDGRADLVIGSRFASPSDYRASRARRLGMRLARRVVHSLLGQQVTDPTSGFRAFSATAIDLFAAQYPTDYMDSVEALVLGHRRGLRVEEVAVSMRPRVEGRPSAGPVRAAWNLVRAVFAVYALHWRLRRTGAR